MTTIGQLNRNEECVIEWLIEDFYSLSTEEGAFYKSPLFVFANLSWFLKMYPDGYKKNLKGYISLYLQRETAGHPIPIEFLLEVKTAEEKLDRKKFVSYTFEEKLHYGCHNLLNRAKVLRSKYRFRASDTLILVCNLKTNVIQPSDDPTIFNIEISSFHKNKVLEDFKELFLKQTDCDVIIKVKEQEFPAHKIILSARSPVFESIFRKKGRGKHKRTGIIYAKGCESSTFSDFLCFLYCGEAEIITAANVFSLYTAAEKYDVNDLIEECVEFMKGNLAVDTFCDTFSWALKHSDRELISLATDFFSTNTQKIVITSKWESFLARNPVESNVLLIKAFESLKGIKNNPLVPSL